MRTRINLGIVSAWLLHAVAWFVPVHKYGVRLPEGLPGWEALRVASSGIWPYGSFHSDRWYGTVMATASAVTTLLFIFGSPLVVLRGSRAVLRLSAWVAIGAFIVNTQWFTPDDRIGYFLWWLSFAALSFGFFAATQRKPAAEGFK